MTRLVPCAVALLLAACASSGGKAPGCHGARRPANPNGSVLAPSAPPTPVEPPAPGVGRGACGARP